MKTDSETYLTNLHKLLFDHFNLAEIQTLCFDLHVDYESVPGAEKLSIIRELLLGLGRNGRLSDLITHLQKMRPHVEWPSVPDDFQLPEALGAGEALVFSDHFFLEVANLVAKIKTKDKPITWDGRTPYIGLTAFQENDAEFFFGQENLVKDLLERVRKSIPFIVITGPSGSGKSSVARAGLFHALRQGHLDRSNTWRLLTMEPRDNPVEQLAIAIGRVVGSPDGGNYIRKHGYENPLALHEQIEILLTDDPRQRCVLLIDQFEAIFSQTIQEDIQVAFINLLTTAVNVKESRTTIVLSVRDDHIAYFFRNEKLCALMNKHQLQLVGVETMNTQSLVRAITMPALKVGVEIDTTLVAQIITDMKGEPGALPLMSFALRDLFDAEKTEKGMHLSLSLTKYRDRGGIESALERHANKVFDTFSNSQKELVDSIFTRLVEVEGQVNKRRIATLAELVPSKKNSHEVLAIVDALAKARLITTTSSPYEDEGFTSEITNETTVTIAHDKLIDAWPWLRELVNKNREIIALRNQINSQAEIWKKGKFPYLLYRSQQLAPINDKWETLHPYLDDLSQQFIKASQEEAEKERQANVTNIQREAALAQKQADADRLRRQKNWLGVVVVVAGIAAIIALFFWNKARQEAIYADTARGTAEAAAITENQARSTAEAESTRALTAEELAARRADEADAARSKAVAAQATSDVNARLAATAQAEARFAEDIAVREKDEAELQAGLAFARELAATAIDKLALDPELCSLLALQAALLTYDSVGTVTTEAQSALHRCLQATQLQLTLPKQSNWINAVIFSPDNTRLATAGQDRQVKIWNALSGQEMFALPLEHTGAVINIAFSPDGKYLVTGSRDSKAIVWDIDSQTVWKVLTDTPGRPTHQNAVNAVAFSPNGMHVATGSADTIAKIWDVSTGESIRIFAGHTNFINGVAFSPDGSLLATASADRTTRIWDVISGELLHTLGPEPMAVVDVAFSPDGVHLVTSSLDSVARLWDVESGNMERVFSGHTGGVYGVSFSPDGMQIATASADGTIKLWDTDSGQVLTILSGHTDLVNDVVFSADGTLLASASDDGTVKLWNTAQQFVFMGTQVALTSDGSRLAAAGGERIRIWNTVSGQVISSIHTPTKEVTQIVFSGTSTSLLAGYSDGNVQIWNTDTGQSSINLPAHAQAPVMGITSSSDGRFFASASFRVIRVWSVNGQLMDEVEYLEPGTRESILAIAFSPTGDRLVAAASDGTMQVRDVNSFPSQVLFSISASDQESSVSIHALAFHPNGLHLATANNDGTISIWDMTIGERINTWQAHIGAVVSLDYSLDGRHLTSSGFDRTIKIWDIFTGERLLNLTSYDGVVNNVVFTPDTERLIAANNEGRILVFIRNIEELITVTRERISRTLTPDECQEYLRQLQCP